MMHTLPVCTRKMYYINYSQIARKIRYLSIKNNLLLKDAHDDVYFLIVESALDPRFRKRQFNDKCTLH